MCLLFPAARELGIGSDVAIADHVWIPAHAVILKGVHLHTHTTVATGSVVGRSTSREGVNVAGNPGVAVREGVTSRKERLALRPVERAGRAADTCKERR